MTGRLILTAYMIVFSVGPAFAYIDPASSTGIMAAIVGFFVAFSAVIKIYWYKLKSFLGFAKRQDSDSARNDET